MNEKVRDPMLDSFHERLQSGEIRIEPVYRTGDTMIVNFISGDIDNRNGFTWTIKPRLGIV